MQDRQFTPTQHSNVVGGSTAGRVLACPASVNLVQQLPKAASSPYADEGTALHEAIEYALQQGLILTEVQDMVGMEFFGHTLTADQVEGALVPAWIMFDEYVEQIEEEDDSEFEFRLEKQGEFPGIEGAFGTTDMIGFTQKRSVIWDWKFGAGVPVAAKLNKQMMFYGAACGNTHPDFVFPGKIDWETAPENWKFDLIVAQPRIDDVPSVWQTTIEELDDFIPQLQAAVKTALGDNPPAKRGEHCRWCSAQPVCPLYKDTADRLHALAEARTDVPAEPTTAEAVSAAGGHLNEITPHQLADWLHQADIVEAWAKSIRQLAFEEAEAGRPPVGMKLVAKVGNLSFKEDVDADKVLANRGLTVAERRVVKTITPTQANKLLKKAGKKELGEKYVERPLRGTTLAPLDDPREAVRPTAEIAKSAAAKLAGA